MNITIIPVDKQPSEATTTIIDNPQVGLSTTVGLVKPTNEDRLGYRKQADGMWFCIADGHWGDAAAQALVSYWLSEVAAFPKTRAEAVLLTKHIEQTLYQRFGRPDMDEEKDFTPEASFIAVAISKGRATIASYGDCRLMVTRGGQPIYNMPMEATWLGAFSHLGLRKRLPVESCLVFEEYPLKPGDQLILFTDGVDECVYEKPTISTAELAGLLDTKDIRTSLEAVLSKVNAYGAEDNASIAVYRA